MAKNYEVIDDVIDADGWIVEGGYTRWDCEQCGNEVSRYRGQSDVDCQDCGACYNACGQRLRDDWRGNPSTWDENIGDLEGFEMQHANDE